MASSSSPHTHSPLNSDSDSDIEPNAHGSHLFWGSLKTPEKSRYTSVDPPRTVIRPHTVSPTRHNHRLSNGLSFNEPQTSEMSNAKMAEVDVVSNIVETDIHHSVDDESSDVIACDVAPQEVNSDIDERLVDSILSEVNSPHPPETVATLELGVKELLALHPSFHSSHLKDLETVGTSINQHSTILSRDQAIASCVFDQQWKSQTSYIPDLVAFKSSLPIDAMSHIVKPLPPTSTLHNGSPSIASTTLSSRSYIEGLLFTGSSTPKTQTSPLLDETACFPSTGAIITEISENQDGSGSPSLPERPITSSNPPSIAKAELRVQQHGESTLEESAKIRRGPGVSHDACFSTSTPKKTSSGSASLAETRKRSPNKAKGSVDNVDDLDRVPISSCAGSPVKDADSDQLLKKERRTKAKREIERARQQLLSLSPASTGLLNLLVSPTRESPKLSTQHGLESPIPEVPMQAGKVQRVPIATSPLQHPPGSPLQPKSLAPISLDDQPQTPARPVMVSKHVIPSAHSALDDSKFSPGRKVSMLLSPTEQAKLPELSVVLPQIRVVPRSPSKKYIPAAEAITVASGSKTNVPPYSASLTIPMLRPNQLPFPLVSDKSNPGIDVVSSSVQPITPTACQQTTSALHPPSSIIANKSSRLKKPYSSPGQVPSRLPVASSLRHTTPAESIRAYPKNLPAHSNRPQTSISNLVPSRIPSPVKRHVPSNNDSLTIVSPLPATAEVAQSINSHKRKRQAGESPGSEFDERPLKRPIVVQPGVNNVHEARRSPSGLVSKPSSVRPFASPVRQPHPFNVAQIRPVVPGTLRHFETTRSSFRDLTHDQAGNCSKDPSSATNSYREDASATGNTSQSHLLGEDVSSTSYIPESSNHPELRRTSRVRKTRTRDKFSITTSSAKRERIALKKRNTDMVQRIAVTSSRVPSSKSSTRSATPLEEFPTNPRLLQTLTDANTLRNQTYIATLERSIVRKAGSRPPSPTTKVRTILEKSKEERSKERERRAERRRRREQGSNITNDTDLDDMDVPSPTPNGLIPPNSPLNKHPRAPGDDEDYVSPERLPKASKLDPTKLVKSVKWDHSLSRKLSKLEISSSAVTHDNATKEAYRKSCLARSLHLDPLGNIPEADVPLEDIEKPHIIVTRFVYDDDIEELPPRAAKKKKL